MADPTIFQIEDGIVALQLVDTEAVGYSDAWQAPGGDTVDEVVIADYDTGSATWRCQVTSAALTASPSTTTRSVPATFCAAAQEVANPGQTAYTVEGEFLQDINVSTGLNRFLFEHDTKEAYVFIGFDGVNPPRAIGRVRLTAATMGGAPRDNLLSSFSWGLTRKPQIEFGTAALSDVV